MSNHALESLKDLINEMTPPVRLDGWYFVKYQGEWRPALYSHKQAAPWSFSPDKEAERLYQIDFDAISDERLSCDEGGAPTGKKPIGLVKLTEEQTFLLQEMSDVSETAMKMLVKQVVKDARQLVIDSHREFWDKAYNIANVSRDKHNIVVSLSEGLMTIYESDPGDLNPDAQAKESSDE